MITAVALFQFAIISLGIMSLKTLVHAHGGYVPEFPAQLDAHALWLYLIPMLWSVTSVVLLQFKNNKITFNLSRVTGMLIAAGVIVCFFMAAGQIDRH